MVFNVKFPALQAKLKSMHSQMLNVEEYNELTMLENLRDVTNALKQKFSMLENLNESMGRKEIEIELSNIFLFDIKKIYTYLTEEEKDFCDLFLSKYMIILKEEVDGMIIKKVYDKAKRNNNLRDVIGTEVDILNLQWIYRSKKFFNYDEDEIIKLLIPDGYRLSQKEKIDLVNTDSTNIIYKIEKTAYKGVVSSEENIYYDFDKYLYKKNMNYFTKSNFDFVAVVCYFNLLGFEIKNIINIIESIRYKSDKSELQKRIIV